ncbi:maleylpyruvate isomerase N-terminal domain-containing protein [Mycobacterium sp.]|uniref:maleylpyruvate isomerase N-terminal domain-containing protein n=1 Tax=Mycobacterium sp. TaxID=1785 RepID=UPI002DA72845|nr:maleylpyruvate isomerase N-terminal domain-containing protein [Mycobacterium sp.]
MTDARVIARLYQETRERILAAVGPGDWSSAVPACPGWSVRDVVAHVTAIADDWVNNGPLSGPPTDADTAAGVARFNGRDVDSIVAVWDSAAAQLGKLAENDGVKAPLADLVVHEHDIRGAIARQGERDSAAVICASDQLLTSLETPVSLRVTVEDAEYHCGPDGSPEMQLRTTRFEALRWRTGRRSRAQLTAMDWSADPAPVLDHLYLFGPADADLIE